MNDAPAAGSVRARATGPLAGAVRAAALVADALGSSLRIEIAFRRGGEAAARARFAKTAERFCRLLGVEVRRPGPLPPGPEVRVANHTSYLDILVLSAAGAGRFLSRHDVAAWPLVGRTARHVGTVFVDRDSAHGRAAVLRSLVTAAGGDVPIIIFPEGRTGRGERGELLPFRRGAFTVARRASVAVRPLAIRYSDPTAVAWVDDMTLLPHLWARLCGTRVEVEIVPLAPIATGPNGASELASAARTAIHRALVHSI